MTEEPDKKKMAKQIEKYFMEDFKVKRVEELAKLMHKAYEKIAKQVGWQTQEECQVPFEDLPEKNKRVMLIVARKVIEFMEEAKEDD